MGIVGFWNNESLQLVFVGNGCAIFSRYNRQDAQFDPYSGWVLFETTGAAVNVETGATIVNNPDYDDFIVITGLLQEAPTTIVTSTVTFGQATDSQVTGLKVDLRGGRH